MTTAPISVFPLIDLCDKAQKHILVLIKGSPVSKPPTSKGASYDFFPDAEEFFQYEGLKDLYKELNFVLRLREMCELAKESDPKAVINLDVKDYTKLSTLSGGRLTIPRITPLTNSNSPVGRRQGVLSAPMKVGIIWG